MFRFLVVALVLSSTHAHWKLVTSCKDAPTDNLDLKYMHDTGLWQVLCQSSPYYTCYKVAITNHKCNFQNGFSFLSNGTSATFVYDIRGNGNGVFPTKVAGDEVIWRCVKAPNQWPVFCCYICKSNEDVPPSNKADLYCFAKRSNFGSGTFKRNIKESEQIIKRIQGFGVDIGKPFCNVFSDDCN